MNYSELVTYIQNTCQNDETTFVSHIPNFIRSAEEKIFSVLEGPLFWNSSTSLSFGTGQFDFGLPAGTLDVLGVLINTTSGNSADDSEAGVYEYLLRKDYSFLAEAYPGTAAARTTGVPRFYSVTKAEVVSGEPRLKIRVAPNPDNSYSARVDYYGKSTSDSITDGGNNKTTWVSVAFPNTLIYGSMYYAYLYMKGEPDLLAMYEKEFNEGLLLLKTTTQLRQDTDKYSDQGQAGGQPS